MKKIYDLPSGTQFVYDTRSQSLTLASLCGMTCGHNAREDDFSCSGLHFFKSGSRKIVFFP